MIRAFLLGLTLVAGPALAEGFIEDQKAVLIDLAVASDCDLTMTEVLEARVAAGLDEQVAEAIADDLIDQGQAEILEDNTVLRLSSELCP